MRAWKSVVSTRRSWTSTAIQRLCPLLLLFLAAASPPHAAPPASAQGGSPPVSLTREQAAAALSVLENPGTRDALIAALRALAQGLPPGPSAASAAPHEAISGTATAEGAKAATHETGAAASAGRPAPAKPESTTLAIPLQPDSLGAQILVEFSRRLTAMGRAVTGALRAMISFPLLSIWISSVWQDQYLHQIFLAVAWRLAVVAVAGLAVERLTIWILSGARAGVARLALRRDGKGAPLPEGADEGEARAEAGETEASGTGSGRAQRAARHLRRAGFACLAFLLDLVPVVVFAGVVNGLLTVGLGASVIAKLVILALVNAYVITRVLLSAVRMLVGAECPAVRLLPASEPTARYTMLWARRILGVSVFGYTAAEVALLFGLYPSLHLAFVKLVALVVHLFLVVIVLQKRRTVRAWLRAPADARGPFAALRNLFAAYWHYFAIFYLVTLWILWAIGVRHGFSTLLRFCLAAIVVIAGAWAVDQAVKRAIENHIRVDELAVRFPGLERRARYYLRGLRNLVSIVLGLVAFLLLLEVWGVDAFGWFASNSLGGRILGAVVVIGITVAAAALVWEAVNGSVERHLARLSREGHVMRSARLRTLLPMLRATLFVIIGIVVGLMALSQIGVNIAPLLAGAGIVGIAIGFGSQKLVQDIITGLFLLLENAMQVGDVVSLGGLSGVVENLSIRTIRLRASDGSIHIVPFSAVTSVTNMTRDFSYAVFNVGIAYKEDVDRVITVLKDLAAEMRKDPEWSAMIRDELEVWGLDQFAASSVVIVCRLRTGPSQRWAVMREFNRRMKRRFDELGIEMPFPHQKLVLDQPVTLYHLPRGTNAPPGVRP
ncbi:MAG TPA: mechanosensitive ion channel domain-containing protein [Acetobacteraceae bacterium]|nr:mechanosensitive ion channel domain-containing protein [Acetobacteraceae bacterium]